MCGMASQLSDAAIEALSYYYAAQALSRAKTGDKMLVTRGKQIFEEGVTSQGIPACELPRPAGARQRYFSTARRAARSVSGEAVTGFSQRFARPAGHARRGQGSFSGPDARCRNISRITEPQRRARKDRQKPSPLRLDGLQTGRQRRVWRWANISEKLSNIPMYFLGTSHPQPCVFKLLNCLGDATFVPSG